MLLRKISEGCFGALLHQHCHFGLQFIESVCEGNIFGGRLLFFRSRVRGDSLLHTHRGYHVAALLRGGNFVFLRANLLQELHSSSLEVLNCYHVDLGHVVLLVTGIDILCDGLRFLHDEAGPTFNRLGTLENH